jgi:hypothetical protein
MLNIRTVILSALVLVALIFAVPWVTARTEVVSDPSSDPVTVLNHQDRYDKMNKVSIPSYRSSLDECFDVPLREAAACHAEGQSLVPSYRSKLLDECSDAGLIHRAQCLKESQESTP